MAAFVPARRAMTWQLTDPAGAPVVRERYWLTFQPGEIRTLHVVPRPQHARSIESDGAAEQARGVGGVDAVLSVVGNAFRCAE